MRRLSSTPSSYEQTRLKELVEAFPELSRLAGNHHRPLGGSAADRAWRRLLSGIPIQLFDQVRCPGALPWFWLSMTLTTLPMAARPPPHTCNWQPARSHNPGRPSGSAPRFLPIVNAIRWLCSRYIERWHSSPTHDQANASAVMLHSANTTSLAVQPNLRSDADGQALR